MVGALFFGRLADHFGRKRMFLVTLAVYLFATVLTAFTWDIASFAFCRFLTGFGIGGFAGPPLYGAMIESGSRGGLFAAYSLAGAMMCAAALTAWKLGVDAERRPLEEVCRPLGMDR